jgi:hypothetical protein
MSTDLFGEVVSDAVPVEPAKVLRTEVRAPARSPVPRRDMTDDEREAVRCLASQVTYPPGSWDKRFARGMGTVATITEKEAAQVWRLFHRYRRQITHGRKADLLALAERLKAPELRSRLGQVLQAKEEKARIAKGVACG